MAKPIDKLAAEIRNLPDKEKLQLVDAILEELGEAGPGDRPHLGRGSPETLERI